METSPHRTGSTKAATTMRRTGTNIKVLMKGCHRLTGNLSVHTRGVVHWRVLEFIGNSKLTLLPGRAHGAPVFVTSGESPLPLLLNAVLTPGCHQGKFCGLIEPLCVLRL